MPARQWQIRMHTTGEKAVFDMGCIADVTDYPFRLQFEQSKLCAIMGEMLAADPLVQMYYGTKIESFEQDDESVTILLTKTASASHLPDAF